jgi:uncharacterized protein (DUF1697 family)
MPIYISMLRGINVGGHNQIKMDALRDLYASLKLENPQTYVQSGNVIFRAKEKNEAQLKNKIQDAIEKKFKFRPEIILRSTGEMRKALAASPFAKRNLEPAKILVTFLTAEPAGETQPVLDSLKHHPEELHLIGRELYIYFPNGAGKSKLPWSQVERLFKVTGTARNLNSVGKMLAMAEAMESE